MIATALLLSGCRTDPLISYLKALGVVRLVAEQTEPGATGRWQGDRFELASSVDENQLLSHFLDDYRPTPLVAPWNGRGGYRREVNRESEKTLARIEATDTPRLAEVRQAITTSRAVYDAGIAAGRTFSKEEDKAWLVRSLRGQLSDLAIEWLDASVALTSEGLAFPPLLGSGGNVGSLDLSTNFNQRLLQVLSTPIDGKRPLPRERSRQWLELALFDRGAPALDKSSNGQFDPGATGGVNAGRSGRGRELDNPWDFVLAVEGALLFASAACRRLGATQGGRAAAPFTVSASAAGYGTSATEESAGEFWAPVWAEPVTLPELRRFLGEGRATWRRRQAQTGLDLARAVATLGVDRGVDRFVRWGLPKRKGTDPMAVRLGSLAVKERAGPRVLADLDAWTARVRRLQDRPASLDAAIARFDRAAFAASTDTQPRNFQDCLVHSATAETAVSLSPGLRERVPPAPRLDPERWLPVLDDGSAEIRLATALARSFDVNGECLLRLTRPIVLPGRFGDPTRTRDPASERPPYFDFTTALRWSKEVPPVPGFGRARLTDVLVEVLRRRSLRPPPSRDRAEVGTDEGLRPSLAFHWSPEVHAADVAELLGGRLDLERLADLISASLLLAPIKPYRSLLRTGHTAVPVVPAWDLLVPFFSRIEPLVNGKAVTLRPRPAWASLLAADHRETVLTETMRELRIAGLQPALTSPGAVAAGSPPTELLAAVLLLQPRRGDVQRALTRIINLDQGDPP